ncbi:MAG: nuclease [Gammaproteobacteria bacterium]|nr:MAG: nuclease [Gammaproteobacteria bacterium]
MSTSAPPATPSIPASRRSSIPPAAWTSSTRSSAPSASAPEAPSRPATPAGRSSPVPLLQLLFLFFAFLAPLAAAATGCAPPGPVETAPVQWVVDGDTVHLEDGRKLRLIGLDTPEIHHDGRPPEPYAIEARSRLQALIGPSRLVSLFPGRQPRDHYGRLLAHLYTPSGASLQAELLRQGLATLLVFPPNLTLLDCYREAEQEAREAGRGLWSLPEYRPVDAAAMDPARHDRGYRVIRGRIGKVGRSRDSLWLRMAPKLSLRILREDLKWFPESPEGWRGRQVEVRGMLYRSHGRLLMRLRHPAQVRLFTRTPVDKPVDNKPES